MDISLTSCKLKKLKPEANEWSRKFQLLRDLMYQWYWWFACGYAVYDGVRLR